eukprot:1005580_1
MLEDSMTHGIYHTMFSKKNWKNIVKLFQAAIRHFHRSFDEPETAELDHSKSRSLTAQMDSASLKRRVVAPAVRTHWSEFKAKVETFGEQVVQNFPPTIRSRFTELCVETDDITHPAGIRAIVDDCLSRANVHAPEPIEYNSEARGACIDRLVNAYVEMRALSRKGRATGYGGRLIYSIRSLVRELHLCVTNAPIYTFKRALYDCLALHFLSSLDGPSRSVVAPAVRAAAFGSDSAPKSAKRLARVLAVSGRAPANEHECLKMTRLWMRCGELVPGMQTDYITKTVQMLTKDNNSMHLAMRCNKHIKIYSDQKKKKKKKKKKKRNL